MSRSQNNRAPRVTGLVASTAVCLALVSVTPLASATVVPHDPPVATGTARVPGYDQTYNHPSYEARYEVLPAEQIEAAPRATAVTLGALGGIAVTGFGIALTLRRRRSHAAQPSAGPANSASS